MSIPTNKNDFETILSHKGSIGGVVTETLTFKELQKLIENKLSSSLQTAQGVLIEFRCSPNTPFDKTQEIMDTLYKFVPQDCDLIFGMKEVLTLQEEEIEVTLLLAGVK